jgi:arylsulfatase
MAVYAAMIDRVDQNIGRLVTAMKNAGQLDNTLLLFLSDNGGCSEDPGPKSEGNPGPKDDSVCVGPGWGWASNAPFRRYKSWIHEGGISTPLIAHWPNQVAAGSFNRGIGHIIDVMPTLIELSGATYPKTYQGHDILPLEGTSLVPALAGKPRTSQPLGWWWSGNSGYRDGNDKAVYDSRTKQWELFDLAKDRSENNNLAEKHPDRLAQLITAWNAWAERTEALPKKK